MIEFDIRDDGTTVTLTKREFFQLLVTLVGSYVDLAEQYIRLHMAGLADFDNEHLKSNLKIIQYQIKNNSNCHCRYRDWRGVEYSGILSTEIGRA